jgi:hypothetical protein
MGSMAFRLPANVPDSDQTEAELERAAIAGGQDGMPFLTHTSVEPGLLVVQRTQDESGFLQIPWSLNGVGQLLFTSATLMERAQPYHLLLELARGKIHQLRNQMSDWTQGGLILHEDIRQQVKVACHAFGKAASNVDVAALDAEAIRTLDLGLRASRELVDSYVDQVFQVRHLRQTQLDTLWGCRIAAPLEGESDALFRQTFNTVKVAVSWQDVEPSEGKWNWDALDRLVDWAVASRLDIIGGPLVDISGRALADWLWSERPDLNQIATRLITFVETLVDRYKDRIRTWQITAASNWSGVVATNDEELLWLTVRLLEAARKIDPQFELVVGLTQPWGEYLASEEHNVTPFSFVDTLMRTGTRIDGLDLEIVMGVTPRGSYCRDPLELSRLLDLYVLLGIPLHLTLGYPSAGEDRSADGDLKVDGGRWTGPASQTTQSDWARQFGRLAMCKPFVRGVSWTHWSDSLAHQFPACGLLDASGGAKPALDVLRKLRAEHLK